MIRERLFLAAVKVAVIGAAGFILIFCLPARTFGQGATPQRGYQPGASYALSDIETINTTNGNLMLNLPLGKLPSGRGGLSGQLNLHYDSKLYDSKTQYYEDFQHPEPGGQPHVAMRNMLVTSDQGGWHYGTGYSLQLIDRVNQYPNPPQFPAREAIYHWKVKVAFPDGSVREFLPRSFVNPATIDEGYYDVRPDGWQTRWVNGAYTQDFPYLTGTLTYYSFDGTYIRLEIQHDSDDLWANNPWTLYLPDGTKVTNNGNRISDRNGNYVEFSNVTYNGHPATQLTDQLGRKIVIEWQALSDGEIIHVPGVGGADLTYQVHWKAIQVYKTYSTVFDDRQGDYPDMLGLQHVVSEIDLPAESGGLKYVFDYNAADYGSAPAGTPSYGWGELDSVTTPTGAQAQYQYQLDGQNGPGLAYLSNEVLKKRITRKTLTYQQQYDGASTPVTEAWNYPDSGNNDNISRIISPDGGIVTQFNDSQRNFRTELSDGTVIEKIWQANVPQAFPVTSAYDEFGVNAYDPARVNGYVKTEFTSIRDANGNLSKTAIKDYSYDKNGNATSVAEYDWVDYGSVPRGGTGSLPTGIPGSAVLKRVITNSYARWTPDASDSSSNNADSYWNSTSPNLKNAISSSEVGNGSATLSRAEFFYDDPATTGNLIQQKRWDSTKGAYSNPLTTSNSISVSTQYNIYGSPILTTDARGYQTEVYYGNVGGFTDLYPTQIKTAFQTSVQRTETREYDFSTGLVTRATDVDNNVSGSTAYDVFGRPTLVKAAEGKSEETRTATEYSDVLRRVIVRSDLSSLGDGKLVSIQHYDQLGRVRLTRRLEDAATQSANDETQGIKVQTRYLVSNPCQPDDTSECLNAHASSLGSYQLVSNPYRAAYSTSASSENTMGWTRSRSDKGGRLIEAQTFAGAGLPAPWGGNTTGTGAVTTVYNANFTTVTDQAGKSRKSETDGLGRLSQVYEDPNGLNYLTTYSYDTLDNLTRVTQGDQSPRIFAYDSLNRLLSAENPESGKVCYGTVVNDQCQNNGYDQNGNLIYKTDARGVLSTYAYDALNRNTSVSYTNDPVNTPAITLTYDGATNGIGRLWKTETAGTSRTTIDSYDVLGRPTTQLQQFSVNNSWSSSFTVSATYDKAGNIGTLTYPSGRAVTYSHDFAGRTNNVAGNLIDGNQRTYTTGIRYSPFGGMTQEQFGTATPVYNKRHYNIRGQLYDVRASTASLTADEWNWNRGAVVNWYDATSGFPVSNYNSGTDNNGNLLRQEVYVPDNDQISSYSFRRQNYTYDSLNRLTSVAEFSNGTTQSFAQSYTYDRWGNRTIDMAPSKSWGAGIINKSLGVDPVNNRLTVPNGQSGALNYDDAGNLVNDTYTGEGAREYDAENRMTRAWANNQWQTYTYDGGGQRLKRKVNGAETWQAYGLGGELLAEYQANASPFSPQKEYGYRNGELLVTADVASPARANVALAASGATASASSTHSCCGFSPAGAINGNHVGPWSNGEGWNDNTLSSLPDWLQVDFSGSKTIDEIDLYSLHDDFTNQNTPTETQSFSLYGLTSFEIKYWNGSTWVTIPNGSVTGNNNVWRKFTFAPVTTNKIRVTINGAGDGYSRIVELEAWGTAAQPANTNVALASNGATASSSSAYTSDYPAASVINGDRRGLNWASGGGWNDAAPNNSFPDWLQVDFNSAKSISEVDLFTIQDNYSAPSEPTETMTFSQWGLSGYNVQYWNAATSAWVTVPGGNVSGSNRVWKKISFASITTTKIRVLTNASADGYSRLAEVEAWGIDAGAVSAELHWLVTDHLGTPRMILDQTGSLANVSRHDYLPFGEEVGAGVGSRTTAQGYTASDKVRQKFTGYERDVETDLDYAQARYYAHILGRFSSVDPLLASAHVAQPQSWNRYTYVLNNPLRLVDPSGMMPGDFIDQDGEDLGTDGINDGKIYLVADKKEAKQIDATDKRGGTTQVTAVSSALELVDYPARQAIGAEVARSNSRTASDSRGGFHEDGDVIIRTANGQLAVPSNPGPYTDPKSTNPAILDVFNSANPQLVAAQAKSLVPETTSHTHPSGVVDLPNKANTSSGMQTVFGGSTRIQQRGFDQPPSLADLRFAANTPTRLGYHMVIGARAQKVYFYNGGGVIATLPLKKFLKLK